MNLKYPVSERGSALAGSPIGRRVEGAGAVKYTSTMASPILDDIKGYVGFTPEDARQLKAMDERLRPHLYEVVDRFYATLMSHPGARQVFAGGEAQIDRLREHLKLWLAGLFCGQYDQSYVESRVAIGSTHVRIGLPQHYMFGAMEIVRSELERLIRTHVPPPHEGPLGAMHRLLVIETSIMLERYKASYSERLLRLEQASMQERLTRAEHLAEIGQLAAALAHELKNPLAGISGAIQVIREEMAADNPHRPVLGEVLRHVGRLDRAVKDLLAYARPHPPRFSRCDLRGIIERVGRLLTQEPTFQHVRFETCVDPEAAALECDDHQIEQVLLNLLLNAAQASPPGSVARLTVSQAGDGIRLVVEDEGSGMEPEVRVRAFDPFYTTKVRGTGLGLPICRGIIEAHQGEISLHSAPGGGTRVEVRLPQWQSEPERPS